MMSHPMSDLRKNPCCICRQWFRPTRAEERGSGCAAKRSTGCCTPPIVNSVALIEVHGKGAELRITDPIENGHIQQTIAVKVSHRE